MCIHLQSHSLIHYVTRNFAALRLSSGMRHPKRINCEVASSSVSSSAPHHWSPEVPCDAQAIHFSKISSDTSCLSFASPSDQRSARASFRRSSSSLISEFDSSVFKFSSSLSFKNPSAFSRCWRQGRSQLHGWGLFANDFIPPGQRITECALLAGTLTAPHA